MKHVYSVEILGEEIFAAGDLEYIFVYKTTDFEIDRMIKTDNSKIWLIGHVQLGEQ